MLWTAASVPCRAAVRWPAAVAPVRGGGAAGHPSLLLRALRPRWLSAVAPRRRLASAAPAADAAQQAREEERSQAARLKALDRTLQAERRERLPYSEFESLCASKHELDAAGAQEAAAELHRLGSIAHFPGTAAGSTIFLRPHLSSDVVAAALAPAAPRAGDGEDDAVGAPDRLVARLREIDVRYQPLQQQRDTLTHIAERKTTRRMWTYFWGVAGQNALFIYLIYGPASWDIMEPVTYFYSQSLIIFWWTYFIFASKELSLSSWRQSFVDMYLTRGMRDTGWTDETTETYQRLGEMRTLCLERIEAQVRRCCPHPAPALLPYPMPRRIL